MIVSLCLLTVFCVSASRSFDIPRWSSWGSTKRGVVSKPQAAEEREVPGNGAACAGFGLQRSQSGSLTVMAPSGDTIKVPAPSRRTSGMCTHILPSIPVLVLIFLHSNEHAADQTIAPRMTDGKCTKPLGHFPLQRNLVCADLSLQYRSFRANYRLPLESGQSVLGLRPRELQSSLFSAVVIVLKPNVSLLRLCRTKHWDNGRIYQQL